MCNDSQRPRFTWQERHMHSTAPLWQAVRDSLGAYLATTLAVGAGVSRLLCRGQLQAGRGPKAEGSPGGSAQGACQLLLQACLHRAQPLSCHLLLVDLETLGFSSSRLCHGLCMAALCRHGASVDSSWTGVIVIHFEAVLNCPAPDPLMNLSFPASFGSKPIELA